MALSPRANSVLLLYLISSLTLPTYAKPNIPSTLLSLPGISTNLSPPDPLITQPAKIPHALFARDIATCGYISGNSAYPLTCPGGYSCTSTVQDLVGWACCNQIQCVGNYRKCADYGAGVCSDEFDLDASACSSIYTSILSCSDSAAPSCFVYARSTKIGDLETAYSYGCGASGGTVLVLATTTGAEGAAATSSNYFPTDNIAGVSPSTSTPTSASSSFNSNSSGLDTGSMIGIIIAAVGTLGTLVGAYYAWKAVQKRRDRDPTRSLQDGSRGQYSTVRPPPYGRVPQVYGAPQRPVYGGPAPPPSYGGHMYPNSWR